MTSLEQKNDFYPKLKMKMFHENLQKDSRNFIIKDKVCRLTKSFYDLKILRSFENDGYFKFRRHSNVCKQEDYDAINYIFHRKKGDVRL
ncbi:unnamed protein product [Heterobilharzia americana]|nr:unnamed protein product [Heterobilharzia americana]